MPQPFKIISLISIIILNSYLDFAFGATIQSNATAFQSGGGGSCKAGEFYREPAFFSESTQDMVLNSPFNSIISSLQCFAAQLNYPLMSDFCTCDCYRTHGASDSEVCQYHRDYPGLTIGCLCHYTEADKQRIRCSNVNYRTVNRSENAFQSVLTSEQKPLENSVIEDCKIIDFSESRYSCLNDACSALNRPTTDLCDSNRSGGLDACAMDCYYTHGSRKSPFGFCSKVNSKVICVCTE